MGTRNCKYQSFAFSLAMALFVPPSTSAVVPDWVDDPERSGFPLWVSAESALQGGQLRPELFPEATHQYLMQQLESVQKYRDRTGNTGKQAASGSTCLSWSVVVSTPPLDRDVTIGDLFAFSAQVYSGTITDLAQGFLNGYPGTVLEISVDHSYKKAPENTPSQIYLHFQHAEIMVEGEFLCTRSSRYHDLPVVGQQIVVFQRSLPTPPILHAHSTEIVYGSQDGKVSAPKELKQKASSIRELEEKLVAMMSSGAQP